MNHFFSFLSSDIPFEYQSLFFENKNENENKDFDNIKSQFENLPVDLQDEILQYVIFKDKKPESIEFKQKNNPKLVSKNFYKYYSNHLKMKALEGHDPSYFYSDISKLANSVHFSSDGKKIITTGRDGNAKVFNSETGKKVLLIKAPSKKLIYTLPFLTNFFKNAFFSEDGNKIVSISLDGSIKIWDSNTGNELINVQGYPRGSIEDVQISSDGDKLTSTRETNHLHGIVASVIDAHSGAVLFTFQDNQCEIEYLKFSKDGNKLLAVKHSGESIIFDTTNGAIIASFNRKILSAQFSKDGSKILVVEGDASFTILNANTGNVFTSINAVPTVRSLNHFKNSFIQFSNDESGVLLLFNGVIYIGNNITDNSLPDPSLYSEGTGEIQFANFSNDGTKVLIVIHDYALKKDIVKILESSSAAELLSIPLNDSVSFAELSSDNKRILIMFKNENSKIFEVEKIIN